MNRTHAAAITILALLYPFSASGAKPLQPLVKVERITGDVLYRSNPNDSKRSPKMGRSLMVGAQIFIPDGAKLEIWENGDARILTSEPGIPGGEPDYEIVPPIDALAKTRLATIRETYVAGAYRGASMMFAPANGANLRVDVPITFRWRPHPGDEQIFLAAMAEGKGWFWQKAVPAASGKHVDADLAAQLQKFSQAGITRFSFACARPGMQPSPQNVNSCAALSEEHLGLLQRELAACGSERSPWHHLLRASAFSRQKLYHDALGELEIGLADPRNLSDRPLFEPAAELAFAVGHISRAEEWRATARSTSR